MNTRKQVMGDGFAIVPDVLTPHEVDSLLFAIDNQATETTKRGGIRNLLDRCPRVSEFADSPAIRGLVDPILGRDGFAARAILFDKTPEANWKVPWHQDLTIAVQREVEATGYGPWSIKDGVPHVQPPAEILEGMLAVRIHLDDCLEENGPLRVVPGSHRRGRLTAEQIRSMQESRPPVTCTVGRGGVLLMRPLLLHASSAATSPQHRRVIHLEFASGRLPDGLEWYAEPGIHRPPERKSLLIQ